MRSLFTLATFGLVLALALLMQQSSEPENRQQSRIELLIEQLGASTFVEREVAEAELRKLSRDALPALRIASFYHDDPEIRFRAERVGTAILMAFDRSRSTGMSLVAIPQGDFEMGSPDDEANRMDDELQHKVALSHPFLLGAHEVTQAQYQQVMKLNPSWFQAEGEGGEKVAELDTNLLPVEQVSWFDAIAFCNQLSLDDGEEPYYQLTDIEKEGSSIRRANVVVLGGIGYRLPTEAEWEYACRSGSRMAFSFGANGTNGARSNVKGMARAIGYGGVEKGISLERTAPVGSYRGNRFGLFDMHGNVAEWCWDWYASEYPPQLPGKEPTGPDQGEQRSVRGGSWLLNEANSRSASRSMLAPGERNYTTGFRVVRSW